MMTALELDPVFVKALGFLRSRSKESTDQLKALLDEALAGTGRSRFPKPVSIFFCDTVRSVPVWEMSTEQSAADFTKR